MRAVPRHGLGLTVVLALGLFSAGPTYAADEHKAELLVEVVHASDSGSSVDPPLVAMKDAFTKSGFMYKSYHRLSREKVTLRKGQPHEIRLPNERLAKLTFEGMKAGSAQIKAEVKPIQTTYTLGKAGSVFLQAGAHSGGMLILVLSPTS